MELIKSNNKIYEEITADNRMRQLLTEKKQLQAMITSYNARIIDIDAVIKTLKDFGIAEVVISDVSP